MNGALRTRILLLVEDEPADAELVQDMLENSGGNDVYSVNVAQRLVEAEHFLIEKHVDIVLLDLRLPDANGLEALNALRMVTPEVPVVVLTGIDDEELALQCLDAGAQDYLRKDELRPDMLRRSIGYAISRIREAQVGELQAMLEHYRNLSNSGLATSVTAMLAGVGPIRDRHPDEMKTAVGQYTNLLIDYIEQLGFKKEKPRLAMERLVTTIGDLGSGPRDLLDLHVAALDEVMQRATVERARAYVIEGRLLALEMMGLLVDYYRVGHRRHFVRGDAQ